MGCLEWFLRVAPIVFYILCVHAGEGIDETPLMPDSSVDVRRSTDPGVGSPFIRVDCSAGQDELFDLLHQHPSGTVGHVPTAALLGIYVDGAKHPFCISVPAYTSSVVLSLVGKVRFVDVYYVAGSSDAYGMLYHVLCHHLSEPVIVDEHGSL